MWMFGFTCISWAPDLFCIMNIIKVPTEKHQICNGNNSLNIQYYCSKMSHLKVIYIYTTKPWVHGQAHSLSYALWPTYRMLIRILFFQLSMSLQIGAE